MVNDQLAKERQQLAKAREEMLAEQRRVIAECYEEKRKVTEERNQLSTMQRDVFDRSRFDRSTLIKVQQLLLYILFPGC